jgi:enoyl-CoA hydratase/carnithine racemase
MTSIPSVHLRREGEVAFVTLDNARRLNVLNRALMQGFVAAMADLAQDETLRAVVIAGAGGKAFVGGADVDEMAALGGPEAARAFIRLVHGVCAAARDMPVPVIARIDGYALGAGLELAAACDLRIAAHNAVFGMPEVRLGIPSVVEAALLPGLVGWGRTRRMLLLGETFGAREALAMGLVETLAEPSEMDRAVQTALDALGACDRRAVRLQKALIRQWEALPLSEAIEAGVQAFGEAFRTDAPSRAMAEWRRQRGRP